MGTAVRLYSGSPSSGSVVVRIFAQSSANYRAPRAIAHTGSRARKNKCVYTLKSYVCVLTSLPEDGEQECRLGCLGGGVFVCVVWFLLAWGLGEGFHDNIL